MGFTFVIAHRGLFYNITFTFLKSNFIDQVINVSIYVKCGAIVINNQRIFESDILMWIIAINQFGKALINDLKVVC